MKKRVGGGDELWARNGGNQRRARRLREALRATEKPGEDLRDQERLQKRERTTKAAVREKVEKGGNLLKIHHRADESASFRGNFRAIPYLLERVIFFCTFCGRQATTYVQ